MTIMLRVLRQVLANRRPELIKQGIQRSDIPALTHNYMMHLDERPPLAIAEREIAEFLGVIGNFAPKGPLSFDDQIMRIDIAIKSGKDLFTGSAAATSAQFPTPSNKM